MSALTGFKCRWRRSQAAAERVRTFLAASGGLRHFDTASCYFWFLYILCSELLYKELPPPFLCFFFSLHPTSSLLVLSLIGRIIRKEFSRESFHLPLIFPHTHIRAERFSGNLCLQFPVDVFWSVREASQLSSRFSHIRAQSWLTRLVLLVLRSGQVGLALYTAASINTCSEDSPSILPAKQTDRDWWLCWLVEAEREIDM